MDHGEIRFASKKGIPGTVFREGKSIIVHGPYHDGRFNSEVDRKTGYVTKNILCAPLKTMKNEVIGVIRLLNRLLENFTDEDKSYM